MLLTEFFQDNTENYRTEKDDNSVAKLSDLRTTRLSLEQLNRLRLMNDVRKLEQEKRIDTVSKQYKPPSEPATPEL